MKYLLVLAFVFTNSAFAEINYKRGEWGSGGGNALVCFPEGQIAIGEESYDVISEIKKNGNKIATKFLPFIETIEMYDLFEAKKRRGLSGDKPEILEITESETIYEYIDRVAKRFKLYNPVLTNLIPAAKELLPDEKFVLHEYAVKYQNDMGEVTLPKENCVIATVAGQVNIGGRENGYYEVHLDYRLFNHAKFSRQSKATLVLHEFIYALSRKHFNHTDSSATRSIVRFYISYSKQFTEGFIAKSLGQLGFINPGSENFSLLVKNYTYSATMVSISEYVEYLHENAMELMSDFYTIQNDDGTFHPIPSDEIEEVYNSVRESFALEKEDFLKDLQARSVVTAKQVESISLKYDHYVDFLNPGYGAEYFFENIRLNRGKRLNMIFEEFLMTTTCTTNSEEEDGGCVDPIKLNNIIPRQ
jgi:hypothetical protein